MDLINRLKSKLGLSRPLFESERALLAGHGPTPQTDKPSLVLFTVHKCASIYIGDVVRALAAEDGYVPINYDGYAYGECRSDEEWHKMFMAGDPAVYPAQGHCFAPMRCFTLAIPRIENYRVLLMLRDPRDVLTSYYYSMAYSHLIPGHGSDVVEKERELAGSTSIDEYVLEKADYFHEVYDLYRQHLLGRNFVTLVKYEEMVSDFQSWLDTVIAWGGFSPSEELYNRLITESQPKKKKEDRKSHIRQITPGDHQRKLKPETIESLNEKFEELLKAFGYA